MLEVTNRRELSKHARRLLELDEKHTQQLIELEGMLFAKHANKLHELEDRFGLEPDELFDEPAIDDFWLSASEGEELREDELSDSEHVELRELSDPD
jgi:hypothetical protein